MIITILTVLSLVSLLSLILVSLRQVMYLINKCRVTTSRVISVISRSLMSLLQEYAESCLLKESVDSNSKNVCLFKEFVNEYDNTATKNDNTTATTTTTTTTTNNNNNNDYNNKKY